jgi:hypothetical protein
MFYDFQGSNSRFFGVTGKKRTTFLLPALDPTLLPVLVLVLDPTLCPALRIAQKWRATWRLWYWRPVMGESGTWVLFMLAPSSY